MADPQKYCWAKHLDVQKIEGGYVAKCWCGAEVKLDQTEVKEEDKFSQFIGWMWELTGKHKECSKLKEW